MNNNNTPEIIRASTPLILAGIGCVIGGMVICNSDPNFTDARWASGMGLAGTAITGAAGLAQSNSKDNSKNETKNTPTQNNKSRVAIVRNINQKEA